ncbi:hypothetical protein MKZ38_001124 [Zalerion maritima]|uniref:Uncharacterized protein n=1 Tax=Zalerion maritima TaxID=339359 RepID=A0AAD5RR78_9PEZI|nr:hypothetical protein MKZ38_001124 [Zalerion maritima]
MVTFCDEDDGRGGKNSDPAEGLYPIEIRSPFLWGCEESFALIEHLVRVVNGWRDGESVDSHHSSRNVSNIGVEGDDSRGKGNGKGKEEGKGDQKLKPKHKARNWWILYDDACDCSISVSFGAPDPISNPDSRIPLWVLKRVAMLSWAPTDILSGLRSVESRFDSHVWGHDGQGRTQPEEWWEGWEKLVEDVQVGLLDEEALENKTTEYEDDFQCRKSSPLARNGLRAIDEVVREEEMRLMDEEIHEDMRRFVEAGMDGKDEDKGYGDRNKEGKEESRRKAREKLEDWLMPRQWVGRKEKLKTEGDGDKNGDRRDNEQDLTEEMQELRLRYGPQPREPHPTLADPDSPESQRKKANDAKKNYMKALGWSNLTKKEFLSKTREGRGAQSMIETEAVDWALSITSEERSKDTSFSERSKNHDLYSRVLDAEQHKASEAGTHQPRPQWGNAAMHSAVDFERVWDVTDSEGNYMNGLRDKVRDTPELLPYPVGPRQRTTERIYPDRTYTANSWLEDNGNIMEQEYDCMPWVFREGSGLENTPWDRTIPEEDDDETAVRGQHIKESRLEDRGINPKTKRKEVHFKEYWLPPHLSTWKAVQLISDPRINTPEKLAKLMCRDPDHPREKEKGKLDIDFSDWLPPFRGTGGADDMVPDSSRPGMLNLSQSILGEETVLNPLLQTARTTHPKFHFRQHPSPPSPTYLSALVRLLTGLVAFTRTSNPSTFLSLLSRLSRWEDANTFTPLRAEPDRYCIANNLQTFDFVDLADEMGVFDAAELLERFRRSEFVTCPAVNGVRKYIKGELDRGGGAAGFEERGFLANTVAAYDTDGDGEVATVLDAANAKGPGKYQKRQDTVSVRGKHITEIAMLIRGNILKELNWLLDVQDYLLGDASISHDAHTLSESLGWNGEGSNKRILTARVAKVKELGMPGIPGKNNGPPRLIDWNRFSFLLLENERQERGLCCIENVFKILRKKAAFHWDACFKDAEMKKDEKNEAEAREGDGDSDANSLYNAGRFSPRSPLSNGNANGDPCVESLDPCAELESQIPASEPKIEPARYPSQSDLLEFRQTLLQILKAELSQPITSGTKSRNPDPEPSTHQATQDGRVILTEDAPLSSPARKFKDTPTTEPTRSRPWALLMHKLRYSTLSTPNDKSPDNNNNNNLDHRKTPEVENKRKRATNPKLNSGAGGARGANTSPPVSTAFILSQYAGSPSFSSSSSSSPNPASRNNSINNNPWPSGSWSTPRDVLLDVWNSSGCEIYDWNFSVRKNWEMCTRDPAWTDDPDSDASSDSNISTAFEPSSYRRRIAKYPAAPASSFLRGNGPWFRTIKYPYNGKLVEVEDCNEFWKKVGNGL